MNGAAGVSEAVAASGPVEKLARLGYIVHGFIYALIGVLAAKLAWNGRGALVDPPSAIEFVHEQPLGRILVLLLAIGLVAYALWRIVQAISDPDGQGKSLKGLFVRIGRGGSGLGYGALAWFSGQLVAGASSGNTDMGWATRFLAEPVGAVAGVLIAAILLCIAGDDIRKTFTRKFGERFKIQQMTAAEAMIGKVAGSWGFAARAVILTSGAVYLLRAVFEENPNRAKGFEGILASLLHLPFGHIILGFVAMGLTAYGLFMIHVGVRRWHPF